MDTDTDPAYACRLDALAPRERERHTVLTQELFSSARWVQEIPRGYAFRFPDDRNLSQRLVEWVALERRCCPFLQFEILLGLKGEPVILRLTGSPGVREFHRRGAVVGHGVPVNGRAAIEIAPLAPEDEPGLLALLTRCGLPLDGVRDHLANALVARQGNRLVGSAVLEVYAGGALLRSVAVEESARGLGLGIRLTEDALALARRLGVRRVFLLTETAAHFFPRFGFRAISREEVPESVRASLEFTTACPRSALAMERAL